MSPGPERLAAALAGRYRLERELGQGGMATVYLATDLKHEREVALKVLKPELAAVLGAERFLAEVKITARLDHPQILTLIDSGEADGQLYYVLPYIRGDSLRARMRQEKQLGLEEALRIIREIASALDYAHQQGVVHRDIKPENILFHEGDAMLADFGIALAVKQAGGNRLTETGLSLGTPQYMSPEQATGDRQLDARSDVYSLAAVCYEMLAGEPPVTGPTVQAVIAKLLTEKPTRLRVVRDTIPEGVEAAVVKALSKVPSDRFASAGEFAAALARAAVPAPARVEPRRTLPRWALPAGIGALLLLAAAIALQGRGGATPIGRPSPQRSQVTFTGNAESASLSPDGTRVAYVARRCDTQLVCSFDLVVQDIGGAGTLTVLRGAAGIYGSTWSPDGRFLLVMGSAGPDWGAYLAPATVQGTPRFLGCCAARFLGGADTVLVTPLRDDADSVVWYRVLTTADGQVRDSIPVREPGAGGLLPSPGGNWFAFTSDSDSGIVVMDRTGRVAARIGLQRPRYGEWLPGGSGLVVSTAQAVGDLADLLYLPLDARTGRLSGAIDTLIHGIQLGETGGFSLNHDGTMLSYSAGQVVTRVVALRRTDATSMRFAARQLKSSTAPFVATVSPDGNGVLLSTQTAAGERPRYQLTMMPFDSGPETVIAPPVEGLSDWVWAGNDGARVAYAVSAGGTTRIMLYEAASGRTRALFTVPDSLVNDGFVYLPDGRFVLQGLRGREVRVFAPDGRLEKALRLPDGLSGVGSLRSSTTSDEITMAGWDRKQDSVAVYRVSTDDGHAEFVFSVGAEGWRGVKRLADGSIQAAISETQGTVALYASVGESGGRRRLGVLPYGDARYVFSSDGKRLIATVSESQADVWLIRNFRELLPR